MMAGEQLLDELGRFDGDAELLQRKPAKSAGCEAPLTAAPLTAA